jgi:biopolymer transport protein ExbD
MARFRKEGKKEIPAINTGSMSDIIFMFLFFFMVITNMREATLYVRVLPPQATEIQKLEKKSLASSIYVGQPIKTAMFGTEPRIQLNDQFAEVKDIREFIEKERAARNEFDRPLLSSTLKVDGEVKMGIVTDIKQELRQVGAFKITYATRRGKKGGND